MSDSSEWVLACNADDIENEDVYRFDHSDHTYAIYNLDGEFHATDGYCTHEQQHLSEGFVIDGIIECPLHMGQFDIETGEAIAGPVCFNLKKYPVKNEHGKIFLKLP